MKVLVCVRKVSSGGAEILESRLAVQLNKIGIETALLSQYTLNYLDTEDDVNRWLTAGVKQVYWLRSQTLLGPVTAAFRLARIVRVHKFDYVITTNTGLDTIASLANLFTKFKHIVALHCSPHPSIVNYRRFKLWQKLAVRTMYKSYAISEAVKTDNLKYLKTQPEKVEVIYNSLNISDFFATAEDADVSKINTIKQASGKKLLFVGRLIQSKGIDILLGLLKSLPADVTLFIVGDDFDKALEAGASNYKAEIIKMIAELKLSERVVLLGACKDIYAIMSLCDVLVHLPTHEGFGLVILEAFASKLPVVTVNVGGIPEVLKGTDYKAIDRDNKTALLSEINWLLNLSDSEKQAITDKAFTKLNYFSDERRAKEIATKILT